MNTVDQICAQCGKVFQRSMWHPQVVTCPECKKGGKTFCAFCDNAHKVEWDLKCSLTGKTVTDSKSCGRYKEGSFTPQQKKEYSLIEYCGGKRWI